MSLWFASVAAAALIAGAPGPPPVYEAPCPSGVSGGLTAGYERESLLAGPLAVFPAGGGYANYPARFIVHVPGNEHRYPGGFVLDGPRCVTLEAWIGGAAMPLRRVVSFGAGACPAA